MTDFSQFEQALRQHWGEDAALARHEIYFIAQRKLGWRQIVHAAGGLLRDTWLCVRLPRQTTGLARIVCVVSLPGANGWGVLAPLILHLRENAETVSVVMHPGLQGKILGSIPAAPDLTGWKRASQAIFTGGRAAIPGVSPWTIRCCLARRQLWLGVWRRTLTSADRNIDALLLHNDFDLFSAAAAEAARGLPPIRSICVQHGLPTDEFFPTRADVQLVWGDSSRKTYLAHNTPPSAILMGTHRARTPMPLPQYPAAPQRILLVSQTHTPIYGRSLASDFLRLATELGNDLEHDAFQILLHPEESRLGHPYATGNLPTRFRNPPHETLIPKDALPKQPALVLGFCSTALVEAAQAGHFVLGIEWKVPVSTGALAVGTPQYRVKNAEEAFKLFNRLRENSRLRSEWLQKQAQWLDGVFTPLSAAWLGECLQNHHREVKTERAK